MIRSILSPTASNRGNSPKHYPEFVAYHFLNAHGELLAIEEDGNNTEKFLKEGGLSVDGSSIKGMLSVERSDLRVVPEEESFLKIQINDIEHCRFLAHLVDETGQPHPRDPRGVLKKLVDKANGMGFEPYMFSEVEFYIVNQDGTPADDAGYCSLPPQDKCYEFRHQLGQICKAAGMNVKRIHHENGPGQNEIELNLAPCLKNADDTVLCMWILDMLAAQNKQKIIFSPKPFEAEAGSGLHHHILLRDKKTGENVFMNPKLKGVTEIPLDDLERLSETCKQGIAGLLKYADEITAVFAASNESFVRLQPGFEAPSLTSWDFSNRTALVRVPQTSNDAVRFEYRGGDLSGSVHLFGSVLLAAVLKGIEEKLEIPQNHKCNVEKLSQEDLARMCIRSVPRTLEHCLKILKTSDFLKEALGPDMVEVLIERDKELLLAASD